MKPTDTLLQRRIGAALVRLREEKKLSRSKAAQFLGTSPAKLRHYEEGTLARSEPGLVAEWARDLGAPQSLIDELKEKARLTGIPNLSITRWEMLNTGRSPLVDILVELEQTAETIDVFNIGAVHGLLQTQAYMHAISRASALLPESAIENVVRTRTARHATVLQRESGAPLTRIILSEETLLRIRDTEFYAEQLSYLHTVDAYKNVSIAVLPLSVGLHACMSTSFEMITAGNPADPDVVYTESPAGNVCESNREIVSAYRQVFADLHSRAIPLARWKEETP